MPMNWTSLRWAAWVVVADVDGYLSNSHLSAYLAVGVWLRMLRVAYPVDVDGCHWSSRVDSDVKVLLEIVVADVICPAGSPVEPGTLYSARVLGLTGGWYARTGSSELPDVEAACVSVYSSKVRSFLSDAVLSANFMLGRAWLFGVLYWPGGSLWATVGLVVASMDLVAIIE